jgi:Asp-tRNA(Asn)/Glu-tRNA(Gln) amidotransferase C subunit
VSDRGTFPPAAEITNELVANLGRIVGLSFPDERPPAIAQRLRDMLVMAAELDDVDLDGAEPANRFDPDWLEGESA